MSPSEDITAFFFSTFATQVLAADSTKLMFLHQFTFEESSASTRHHRPAKGKSRLTERAMCLPASACPWQSCRAWTMEVLGIQSQPHRSGHFPHFHLCIPSCRHYPDAHGQGETSRQLKSQLEFWSHGIFFFQTKTQVESSPHLSTNHFPQNDFISPLLKWGEKTIGLKVLEMRGSISPPT